MADEMVKEGGKNMGRPNIGRRTMRLQNGWLLTPIVDDDGHLNIYIENMDGTSVEEIDTGQGTGRGEQLAIRLTTSGIEQDYQRQQRGNASGIFGNLFG